MGNGRNGRCRSLTKAKVRCRMPAKEDGVCVLHPQSEEGRKQLSKRNGNAGRANRRRREKKEGGAGLGPLQFKSPGDVVQLLEQVANAVWLDEMEPAKARILVTIAKVLLNHIETRDLARRVVDMEETIKEYYLDHPEAHAEINRAILELEGKDEWRKRCTPRS